MGKKFKVFLSLMLLNTLLYSSDYGELLLHGNCTTCHNIQKNISAPSLKIIRQRYISAFPKKEDFVFYMSQWVLKPNEKTSIMSDMIDKYELMPQLGYDIDTLQKISEYIYKTKF